MNTTVIACASIAATTIFTTIITLRIVKPNPKTTLSKMIIAGASITAAAMLSTTIALLIVKFIPKTPQFAFEIISHPTNHPDSGITSQVLSIKNRTMIIRYTNTSDKGYPFSHEKSSLQKWVNDEWLTLASWEDNVDLLLILSSGGQFDKEIWLGNTLRKEPIPGRYRFNTPFEHADGIFLVDTEFDLE